MASEYFKNFPNVEYTLSSGKVISIKDFFRKSKIETEALDGLVSYTYYEIQDGERPDVVATKLYGNGDLHWTLFLANEFTNYNDWHKDTQTFETYMNEKYQGQYLVGNETTDIVSSTSKFLLGEQITSSGKEAHVVKVDPTMKRIGVIGNEFVGNDVITGSVSSKSMTVLNAIEQRDGIAYYKDTNGVKKNFFENGFSSVSFFDEEWETNEAKRKIRVIRPELIQQVVNVFERIMSD